jgi:hypothetical protein
MARRGKNGYLPEPMDVNAIGVRQRYGEDRRRYHWTRVQSGESAAGYTSEAVSSGESESDVSRGEKGGRKE